MSPFRCNAPRAGSAGVLCLREQDHDGAHRFPRAGRGRLPVPGRMTEEEMDLVAEARSWLIDTFVVPYDPADVREILAADPLKICSLISARYDGGWTKFAADRTGVRPGCVRSKQAE